MRLKHPGSTNKPKLTHLCLISVFHVTQKIAVEWNYHIHYYKVKYAERATDRVCTLGGSFKRVGVGGSGSKANKQTGPLYYSLYTRCPLPVDTSAADGGLASRVWPWPGLASGKDWMTAAGSEWVVVVVDKLWFYAQSVSFSTTNSNQRRDPRSLFLCPRPDLALLNWNPTIK